MSPRIVERSFIDRVKCYTYRIKLLPSECAMILRHDSPYFFAKKNTPTITANTTRTTRIVEDEVGEAEATE
jgi:hypothetical protein